MAKKTGLARRLAQVSAQPDTCWNFLLGFAVIRDQHLTLLQLLLAHGVATIPDYLHLQEHWFDDAKGWWPGQHAEQVMAEPTASAVAGFMSEGRKVVWMPAHACQHEKVFTLAVVEEPCVVALYFRHGAAFLGGGHVVCGGHPHKPGVGAEAVDTGVGHGVDVGLPPGSLPSSSAYHAFHWHR